MKVIDPTRGLYSGKSGGYIFYVRNGKTYARRMPDPRRDYTPTEKQAKANRRFGMVQRMYRFYRDYISADVWRIAAREEGRMAHAYFHSVNAACFNGEGELVDHRHFRFAMGSLLLPRELRVEAEGEGWFRVRWEEEREQANAAGGDRLMVGVIHEDYPLALELVPGVEGTRGEGQGRFRVEGKMGEGVHVYLFFAREDGTAYSPSEYTRVVLPG